MKFKKGDKVVIIAGQDKGKKGTISKILTKSERVTLEGEGLAKVKKHLKPSQIAPDGGIMDVDKPIHVSNIMLLDPKEKKRTRIGYKEVTRKTKKQQDETETVRYAKKSGEVLE
ncbi:MAG TPA: 50S ribosomal protein L24 [Bacillota bacterium]|nr:50S ribosomal protein L24 [Bacillota bacterium]HPF42002.1 50S ribosomal protein L24 [Bacillota bacterium]HPJ85924.1 50S ribosomal protein L24 [Bacillota bacterium]HPQ61818.1 50S ribosomal protein L24 [Bacillota bacterium]HRX91205.1 50S ribosomal protein L24 [Candidatus Izemoplasmatales bacterium]